MLRNTRFQAVQKYAFNSLVSLLNDLYAPIIGHQAIHVYHTLLSEAQKQSAILGILNDINEYLRSIGMDLNTFSKAREQLEALGLMSTFLETNNITGISTYYFQVHEPLGFDKFIANQKFRHLLIKSIGQTNYERLEYLYTANRIPRTVINVSTPFETIFNDQDINAITSFNFQALHATIAKHTSSNITISENAQKLIESFFNTYNLTIKEIEYIVSGSVICSDDGLTIVDIDLLRIRLTEFVNSIKNVDLAHNISVNRDKKIFSQYCSKEQLLPIFNDYQTFNAEQYLRAILKTSLNDDELKVIKTLREKYLLSDAIINIIIDLTINRTNGRVNYIYATKVAKTINALNLKTLEEIYDYFHHVDQIGKQLDQKVTNGPKNDEIE
jgi:replication initiation and membrane attachment protein DnaB